MFPLWYRQVRPRSGERRSMLRARLAQAVCHVPLDGCLYQARCHRLGPTPRLCDALQIPTFGRWQKADMVIGMRDVQQALQRKMRRPFSGVLFAALLQAHLPFFQLIPLPTPLHVQYLAPHSQDCCLLDGQWKLQLPGVAQPPVGFISCGPVSNHKAVEFVQRF